MIIACPCRELAVIVGLAFGFVFEAGHLFEPQQCRHVSVTVFWLVLQDGADDVLLKEPRGQDYVLQRHLGITKECRAERRIGLLSRESSLCVDPVKQGISVVTATSKGDGAPVEHKLGAHFCDSSWTSEAIDDVLAAAAAREVYEPVHGAEQQPLQRVEEARLAFAVGAADDRRRSGEVDRLLRAKATEVLDRDPVDRDRLNVHLAALLPGSARLQRWLARRIYR